MRLRCQVVLRHVQHAHTLARWQKKWVAYQVTIACVG